MDMDDRELLEKVRLAAAGDRAAAEVLMGAVQDGIYRLALRMLGHPADAEDAAQEILVVLLTHLGSFRGESAFRTWVWRVAANHLLRFKRGRRETISLEVLAERLDTGLRPGAPALPEAEANLFAAEIRLRCTQAMLLGLDREGRIAYILADIMGLSGQEAAAALELDPATYRKRLSRARARLYEFLRARCGVYDAANPCRCAGQVECAIERGLLDRHEALLARHPVRDPPPAREAPGAPRALDRPSLERGADEVVELFRVAAVMRDHPAYAAPERVVAGVRALLRPGSLVLFRD
jgi:RNA polymerase sigma factor (sigma-70 family)